MFSVHPTVPDTFSWRFREILMRMIQRRVVWLVRFPEFSAISCLRLLLIIRERESISELSSLKLKRLIDLRSLHKIMKILPKTWYDNATLSAGFLWAQIFVHSVIQSDPFCSKTSNEHCGRNAFNNINPWCLLAKLFSKFVRCDVTVSNSLDV